MVSCALCETSLQCIGAAAVLYAAVKVLNFVRTNYFVSCNPAKRYAKAGSWAVVTGASDGIGRAFAEELAKKGMNVCIIARTKSKLDEVAEEITKRGAQAKVVVFDFADATPHQYKKLFTELDSIQIGVLVNNVGINYLYGKDYDRVDVEEDMRILKVNCESQLQMTKYVLPKMKEKRCGAIINLSSVSALLPAPLLATYAATKSFNLTFSSALQSEVSRYGIDVLSVTPNTVVSKMTQGVSTRKPKSNFFIVPANAMARQTINKLAATHQTAGHANHALLEAVFTSLPRFVQEKVIGGAIRSAAKKAEKREAEQKKQ